MSWVPYWKNFYSIIILNVLKMISKWCLDLNGIIIHYTLYIHNLKQNYTFDLGFSIKVITNVKLNFYKYIGNMWQKSIFPTNLPKKHVGSKLIPKNRLNFLIFKKPFFKLFIWKANDCIGSKTCTKLMNSFTNNLKCGRTFNSP